MSSATQPLSYEDFSELGRKFYRKSIPEINKYKDQMPLKNKFIFLSKFALSGFVGGLAAYHTWLQIMLFDKEHS